MTTVPQFAAILVNYNAGPEIERALRSIVDEMGGESWQGIVIDNASVDGSATKVNQFLPHVRLIRNDANVGFARGVNQGLAATTAPYVLIMNPDCRLMAGAIAALRGVLDAQPRCALTGPRVLNPDGSVQGSARGDPDMLTGLFGRTTLLRKVAPFLPIGRRNIVVDEAIRSGQPSAEVDWVSGACMLVRRTAFDQVEGMDERFFLYWEDADLCKRIGEKGWRTVYFPGATVVHAGGRSSIHVYRESLAAFHRSAFFLFRKHARWPARLFTPIVYLALEMRLRALLFVHRHRLRSSTAQPATVNNERPQERIRG